MKTSKNTLALVLIASSIILLLALQVFWLTNSYEKAYFDLRRETNGLFRATVMALRDSMLVKSFEKLPSDSVWKDAFRFTHKMILTLQPNPKSDIDKILPRFRFIFRPTKKEILYSPFFDL
jgi:hypothetical protein